MINADVCGGSVIDSAIASFLMRLACDPGTSAYDEVDTLFVLGGLRLLRRGLAQADTVGTPWSELTASLHRTLDHAMAGFGADIFFPALSLL